MPVISEFIFKIVFFQHKFWVERTGVSVVAVAPYYIGEDIPDGKSTKSTK